MERVRALRAAVLSGSYQVSTQQLAGCLLEHMLQRGQTSRGWEMVQVSTLFAGAAAGKGPNPAEIS